MFIWLEDLVQWFVYNILGFGLKEHMGVALEFFIYDSIKIFLLMIVIVSLMNIINHYMPMEKIRYYLANSKYKILNYFIASFFGAITPFCSCSSIPLFVGFLKVGIPLGVTFAFLITSPLVNQVALGLFVGMFGLTSSLIYAVSGIIVGVVGGLIIDYLNMDDQVADFIQKARGSQKTNANRQTNKLTFKKVYNETISLLKKIMPYVLLGVAVGGLIHGYVPENFFQTYIGKENLFAVPLATILGVPLYSSASGIIPIVGSLVDKGVPMGTAIAFMMSTIGLSLPNFMILKKVMKMKLLVTFYFIVTILVVILGYFYNIVL